jgi:predicted ArsR family transcriptional regulator
MASPSVQEQARALGDPTRHRIFRLVVDSDHPVMIAELTEAMGLHHNAVRQHLAQLVAAGLVLEEQEERHRPGRPRLQYRPTPGAGSWGGTDHYEQLALVLLEMRRTGESPVEVGRRVGHHLGRAARGGSDPVEAIVEEVTNQGFDPVVRRRGSQVELILQSCPYVRAAELDGEVVCDLHRGLAEGLAAANGSVVVDGLDVRNPREAGCRLHMHVT